jgi:hypothetical protein
LGFALQFAASPGVPRRPPPMNRCPLGRLRRLLVACLLVAAALWTSAEAGTIAATDKPVGEKSHATPCGIPDNYFANEVWPKVASSHCLECHKAGGDAEDSKFILRDPSREADPSRAGVLEHNRAAFTRMAAARKQGRSPLLLKATGGLSHGGEEVLKPDSTAYGVLAEFVRRAEAPQTVHSPQTAPPDPNAPDFFHGIAMLDGRRLLRRATLSLGGRLPMPEEVKQVEKQGLKALGPLLDGLMKEDAFYERLARIFHRSAKKLAKSPR